MNNFSIAVDGEHADRWLLPTSSTTAEDKTGSTQSLKWQNQTLTTFLQVSNTASPILGSATAPTAGDLSLQSQHAGSAVIGRFRNSTALMGLSLAMIAPHSHNGGNPLETVATVATTNSTAPQSAEALPIHFSAATVQQARPIKATVAAIVALRQIAGSMEAESHSVQARLEESLQRFLIAFGAAGFDRLLRDIENSPSAEYDSTSILLNSLTSVSNAGLYKEPLIDTLISLLRHAAPALRYEAAAALVELKAERSATEIATAASREQSRELKAYLTNAERSLRS